jgi:hypothetical protein
MKRIPALVLALAVCASAGADTEISVERAESSINSGFKERVYIDGKEKLSLANGASGKIIVPDGEHTIHATLYTLIADKVTFGARSSPISFVIIPNSAKELTIENRDGSAPASTGASAKSAPARQKNSGVENSLEVSSGQLMAKIPAKSKIAIVNVASNDQDVTEFIAGELEFILVNAGLTLIDRSQLDQIRKEQNFQISGAVDDASAVSIGKLSGANVIITGAVTGSGDLRRLRLRALSTQTGQVMAVTSEKY